MAIRRKKRIDLHKFDAEWQKHDMYILVNTLSFNAIQKMQADINKLSKKAEESEADSEKLMAYMIKLVTDNVKGGQVYDMDEEKKREIKPEDIQDFDQEVLTYIIQNITGSVEKKS